MTLGSLFDGSGGFPLAGSMYGIIPVWCSEVEPYPIAVTKSRFPDMIHLGDVTEGQSPNLTCTHDGEPVVCYEQPKIRYIVRRLTPTECARLQGFPDTWGHPDKKDEFTDDEYRFWTNVRNTHASINGKQEKYYGKDQMLKWYNKLHTDSAEYKMYGNGIALPTALYVMQGIAETKNTNNF